MEDMEFTPLAIPYITNVTARKVTDTGEIKGLLAKQVYSPVRWMQSMDTMQAEVSPDLPTSPPAASLRRARSTS